MRSWLITTMLAAVGVATAATAEAQTAPPSASPTASEPDVVVTGRKGDRKKEVQDYVRALAGIPGPDPMARFDRTELCPAAVGLTASYDAAITERMRRIGKAADITVAASGCKPNILVIFAQDKSGMIEALRRSHPAYFRDAYNRDLTIPRQQGPATAWHLYVRVDKNGVMLPPEGEEPVNVTLPDNASRIARNVRPVLVASVVVIEWDAVNGLTTTQIGDYAAMRSFAQIDPARLKGTTAPTILTVLEAPMDSEVPASLTQWDLSYLRALYATDPYHSARSQRTQIGRQVNGALAKEQGSR